MMIMATCNTSGVVHYLAGAYPNSMGMLLSPNGWKNPPFYMPYAIDNGAFTGFDADAFKHVLFKTGFFHKPLWVAVPDVVADAEATNKQWHQWKDKIPYPLAFVAQDGHKPQDIPAEAFAVFVGGTTDWKIKNAHRFKGITPWLHVGRVNTISRLEWAADIGADSIDGTGWFRNPRQKIDLINFVTGTGQLKMPWHQSI